jgi:hypothetical protein
MMPPATTDNLLPTEAAFLAAMQRMGFGSFEYLQIRDGQLLLDPWPTAVRDVKFASSPNTAEPADGSSALKPQVIEFFSYVRDVDAGEIRELEVRHGIPFSMEIELPGAKALAAEGGRRG